MTKGWGWPFEEPIEVDGKQLVTLQDAGEYITTLPKKEHAAPEWQAAMQALILVAESGGPTMLARIGVMQALNRHHVPELNPRVILSTKFKWLTFFVCVAHYLRSYLRWFLASPRDSF